MRLSILTVLLSASVLTAQATVTLPTPPPLIANTSLPLSAGIGRYQQWFSAAQTQTIGTDPIRIDRLEIFGGTLQLVVPTVDIQVTMSHAPGFGIGPTFDQNYVGTPVVVKPRGNLQLTPGIVALTVDFVNPFTWDGVSPFLVEIRIFGNGASNASFNFDLRGTDQGIGSITRVFQGGNASAITGTVSPGQGLFMRFRTKIGGSVAYGQGCRGVNFIQPTYRTTALPAPGVNWTHRLENAAAQTFCMLVLGSTEAFTDCTPINGGFGCFILATPDMFAVTTTIGGSGTATADVIVPVPPLTTFIGVGAFSQFLVLDPGAPNGVMSATNGIHSICSSGL